MKYVVWAEPDLEGKPILRALSPEEVVQLMKIRYCYESDQEALDDFLAENWGWMQEDPPDVQR